MTKPNILTSILTINGGSVRRILKTDTLNKGLNHESEHTHV